VGIVAYKNTEEVDKDYFPHISPVGTGRNVLLLHLDGGNKAILNAFLLGTEQWICQLSASKTA
jgi:hypothetical protein